MKVLWLSNVVVPLIADEIGLNKSVFGGWINGFFNQIKINENIELCFVFPVNRTDIIRGCVDNVTYYGFPSLNNRPDNYCVQYEIYFKAIIEEYKPDIVHIFGTEYPHTLSMVKVFSNPERTIINIQGLTSICSYHYYSNLPFKVIYGYSLKDLLKNNNIYRQKRMFEKRGLFENNSLNLVGHVIGRTDWDKACSLLINDRLKYHFCNEILRDEFYKHYWDINKCEKFTIFISQGDYPIKGLHFLIKALRIIKNNYPNVQVYIAGNSIKNDSFINRIKQSYYQKYILKLICKHELTNNVIFTGILNEKEMCERMVKSHVFVSPSIIENESNSLSEAKIMGVPSVVSFVGGVTNRINHKNDCLAYSYSDYYMLAFYVQEIFRNSSLAESLSNNAIESSKNLFNKTINSKRLFEIYNEIIQL